MTGAFRLFPRHRPSRAAAADTALWLEALGEAAAVCEVDGQVVAANRVWAKTTAALWRSAAGAGALHGAFRDAARAGRGRGELDGRPILIARLDEDRFLLRAPCPEAALSAPAPQARLSARLAAPAPFGAALIEGDDPFTKIIAEASPALWSISGRTADAGLTLSDLIGETSREEAAAQWADGDPGPFEVVLAAAPERSAQLHLVPAPGGFAAYLIDVTAQKDLQLQLAQRHKMEAIGQLAGGVAHDFNNLLSAIGMRVDELLQRHPLGDPDYDNLSQTREAVNRAAALVLQLLTFSRKATVRRQTVDLTEALVAFEILMRRLLRENMRLETEYGADTPPVRVDRGQLEMAMMNLVVNARDAMAGRDGGVIRIRAARVSPAEADRLGFPGRPKADMALIEVADTGPGIPEAVIASIFDPFFTTKAIGEGTGLGLATVYGIVKQADGAIIALSPPGEGAIFRIFLPPDAPRLTVEAPQAPPARRAPRDLSGAGRILFVEDEDRVRDIAARLLRGRGYEVIEGRDGEEALELAKANAGRIDLMISDVSMPGMDGPALLKAARPYLGAAPVMFISGYAESEFSDLLEGETGISFLPKPLNLQSLAERVKERLQSG
jgi:two-component system cell cycle sensor histidine kinase/response regulator CckA